MILVKVSGCDLTAKPLHAVTSGTVGRMVSFEFSPEWAELVKTAVFKGSGTARDVALLASDTCTIPLDVLDEYGGDLEIGVYGRNEEGTVVMPTVWGRIEYIREGVTLSDADPSEPAPDWTAQVQAAAASALEKAEAVEAAAARGDFDGQDGEDGFSPAVTITPVTGGHTVTITDKDHPAGQSFDVLDGSGGGGGGGGTGNYNDLLNKPQINSIPLYGNLSAADLGLAAAADVPTKTSDLTNDSGFLTSAPVTSVNGEDGDVVLTQDDIGSGSTYARTHNDYTDADKAAVGTISGKQTAITANGILKGVGTGTVTAAQAGQDYQAPLGVTGASAGQYVKIKTVDASGVPTAYEAGTPSGGGGGTTDYDELTDKPQINSVTLSGNKSAADLGIAAAADIPTKTSDLTNDSGFITSVPVTSVNGQTGAVSLSIPSTAAEVGAIAAPPSPASGNVLTYNGSAWAAAAPSGGGSVTPSDTNPANLAASASPGSLSAYSRGDHVHKRPTLSELGAQPAITATGILKRSSGGTISGAAAGTDYQAPITAGGILYGDGSGGVSQAEEGWDYTLISLDTVTLYAEDWTQLSAWGQIPISDLYAQTIEKSVINHHTKVDVQADPAVYAQLIKDGVQALFAGTQQHQNTTGCDVVFYALGACPSEDVDVQFTYYDIR